MQSPAPSQSKPHGAGGGKSSGRGPKRHGKGEKRGGGGGGKGKRRSRDRAPEGEQFLNIQMRYTPTSDLNSKDRQYRGLVRQVQERLSGRMSKFITDRGANDRVDQMFLRDHREAVWREEARQLAEEKQAYEDAVRLQRARAKQEELRREAGVGGGLGSGTGAALSSGIGLGPASMPSLAPLSHSWVPTGAAGRNAGSPPPSGTAARVPPLFSPSFKSSPMAAVQVKIRPLGGGGGSGGMVPGSPVSNGGGVRMSPSPFVPSLSSSPLGGGGGGPMVLVTPGKEGDAGRRGQLSDGEEEGRKRRREEGEGGRGVRRRLLMEAEDEGGRGGGGLVPYSGSSSSSEDGESGDSESEPESGLGGESEQE